MLAETRFVIQATVDDKGNENMMLVPIPAQAGYSLAHNEAVNLQQFGTCKIPGFERGDVRRHLAENRAVLRLV